MLVKFFSATVLSFSVALAFAANPDIVVVGSGGAGLSSAITAAQAGKKVLVLEKMPYYGGNSNRSEGGMNAPQTKLQIEHGLTTDSPELMNQDTQKGGHYLNNPELTLTLSENAK